MGLARVGDSNVAVRGKVEAKVKVEGKKKVEAKAEETAHYFRA